LVVGATAERAEAAWRRSAHVPSRRSNGLGLLTRVLIGMAEKILTFVN
jgi:hypothetical protein